MLLEIQWCPPWTSRDRAPPPPVKLQDPTPPPTVPDVLPKDYSVRSDPGSEDCHVVGDPVVSPADFQRQIQMEQSSGDNGWFNGQIPFCKLQRGSMHLSCNKSFLYFFLSVSCNLPLRVILPFFFCLFLFFSVYELRLY